MKIIEREHELFSSFSKAQYRYPNITFSFLEADADLIHSCHFVYHAVSPKCVISVILVTYANYGVNNGVRLSCSKFEDLNWIPEYDGAKDRARVLMENHLRVSYFFIECLSFATHE